MSIRVVFCSLVWWLPGITLAQDAVPDTITVAAGDTLASDFRIPIRGPKGLRAPVPYRAKRAPIAEFRPNEERVIISRDSLGNFLVHMEYYGVKTGPAIVYSPEAYARAQREKSLTENWRRVIQDARRRQQATRGLLDFRINIPGGQRSAFTTIFGKPEVNLRVTGTANMNLGVSIQETEDPAVPADLQKRIDPTFDQNLKLNIQGTIGDKLSIRTDWDTERAFNYQNRLSIVYTGYEDEIIQSIELGNVSMETGNSLVRGGGALFGIKSRARMGPLELTGILSQQEGKGNSQTLKGGTQEVPIDLRPNQYDNDRHYFIDFFALQEFEQNLADPTLIRRLFSITNLEVWVLNETLRPEEGQRSAIALLDYGVIEQGGQFLPPNEALDAFDPAVLEQYRDPSVGVSAAILGVESDEFAEGVFIPLRPGVDYDFDENLGILSLRQRLNPRQALAISFAYRDLNNQIIYVGDVNLGDSQRLFLKLLRPSSFTPSSRSWPLTLRNIYSLGTMNVTRENLEFDIYYTIGSTDQTNLPGLGNILLQDLGLDRVGSQGQIGADNQIDFGTGTLNPRDGRVMFPYLEPFGQRIIDIIQASSLGPDEKTEALERYAFPELYQNTQNNAANNSKNNLFRLKGITRGGVSDSYFLGWAIVEGSVRVTANGRELVEGIDYEVDYSLGNILITNQQFLAPGQEIKIDYESNNIFQIQQTTFAGLRAEYTVGPDIKIGSTVFRQKDRPLQDKIPIGEEPINNMVLGFDAKGRFDTPWLTRAIDKVPLLQTKSPSSFSFTGEFAQIRPGVAQTNAVERAIRNGSLYSDEEQGLAFIDDFEGSKTSISFLSPGRWSLAAAPHAVPGYDIAMDIMDESLVSRVSRADLRAQFSWYTIPISLGRITGASRTVESLPVLVTDVFPDRDVLRQDNILQTLDVHFNPRDRGPYNYNQDLKNLTENEQHRMWGGMTAVIPSGLDDLTQNNIEFLEFWVQAILPDGRDPTAQDFLNYDGTIYFDLGVLSEDIVPNNINNSEDGLAERSNNLKVDQTGRSYVYNNLPDLDGQFSQETIALEDVGMDGAPNTGDIDGTGEDVLFASFIQAMELEFADNPERLERIRRDPSNDDYVYFDSPEVRELPLHERFHRMYGYHEGNARTGTDTRANTSRPDSEGLLNPAVVNLENSYYQYELPFNPADTTRLRIGDGYIIDKVDGGQQWSTWYQVRIPLRDFVRAVGNIENLQRVNHIRMWMSGYRDAFTMRFATFELVGNQWRKAEEIGNQGNINTLFEVSTINIEANSNRRPVPYRIPEGAIRSVQRGQQEEILANEQAMVLRVEDLRATDVRMVRRLYPMGMNLTHYSNMRMFVHGEGYRDRNDVELVVRMGSNLETDYYEYRQPVTPTDTNHVFGSASDRNQIREDTERIWLPDENSMNLVLSELNQIKQLRNLVGADPAEVFERAVQMSGAPAGTIIAIKGEPTLNRITEIGIGVRNPLAGGMPKVSANGYQSAGVPSLDAELWVNELRVSGFENEAGWSANLRTSLVMADFATVNASITRSTDGFGNLDSRVSQRQQFDRLGYDLNTTVNLHRFIPERYGWNIPLSLSTAQNTQTPKFLPREGDIRFDDFQKAIESSDATEEEKKQLINDKLNEIQTYNDRYSVNLSNISKRFSQSRLGQLTLDNTRLSYVYNTNHQRDYQVLRNDSWNYTSSINYQHTVRNVKLVKPFNFLRDVPVARMLAPAQFAYLPSSFNYSATLNRNFSENVRREFMTNPSVTTQNHTFRFSNQYGFSYTIMPPVTLGFSANTNKDLALIAQDSIPGTSLIRLRPTFDVLRDVVFEDSVSTRRSDYQESYTASWRPRLNTIKQLNWLTYSASYRGGFRWQNSALGSGRGANLTNQYQLDQNTGIRVQEVLKKVSLYEKIARTDDQERRARETERNRLQQQRDRERQQRQREREAAKTAGQTTPPTGRGTGVVQPNRPAQQQQQPVKKTERSIEENLTYYSRRFLLSALSFQNLDMNYSHQVSSAQQGYAGGSQLFEMFNDENGPGYSPPFAYRIGLSNRLSENQLIRSPNPDVTFPLSSSISKTDNITIRTSMQPNRQISLNLDWNASWDNRVSGTQTVGQEDVISQQTQTGTISASVWSFGGGYTSLYRSQLQAAFDDMGTTTVINDADGNRDGRTVLNPGTLQDDFRRAYLFGAGSGKGGKGFTPLPLPNWRLTWSGLEKRLPFLSSYLNRATITHTYSGRYRLGWVFNPDFGVEQSRQLGQFRVDDIRDEFQPNSVNVERQFNPLIGLNLTWKSGIGTDFQFNSSKITSFSLSNTTVTERNSQGIRLTARYSKRGFRLPLFPRLQNTLDMSLSASYIEDITLTYRLNSDLQDVLSQPPSQIVKDVNAYAPSRPNERGDIRIQITPVIGYQFSSTVKANFEYNYQRLIPKSTGVYPRINQDLRFNVVVSIRS